MPQCGTKLSLLVDGDGIPLAVVIAGTDRHDMKLVEQTLEAQPLVPAGVPPDQQRHLCSNKGYDYDEVRQILQA